MAGLSQAIRQRICATRHLINKVCRRAGGFLNFLFGLIPCPLVSTPCLKPSAAVRGFPQHATSIATVRPPSFVAVVTIASIYIGRQYFHSSSSSAASDRSVASRLVSTCHFRHRHLAKQRCQNLRKACCGSSSQTAPPSFPCYLAPLPVVPCLLSDCSPSIQATPAPVRILQPLPQGRSTLAGLQTTPPQHGAALQPTSLQRISGTAQVPKYLQAPF